MKKKIKEKLKKNQRVLHLYARVRYELTCFGFIRNCIFFPIRRLFRKSIYMPDYCKCVGDLKDIHKGERCFIISTGPSLSVKDIEMIGDNLSIAVNSIFKLYNQTKWRPTYYAMTDPLTTRAVFESNVVDYDSLALSKCIFNAINKKDLEAKCKKAVFVDTNWLDHVYNYGKSTKFKFCEDLRLGVYDYYSITQECIIYAIYMGVKEIILLGADNDYLGKKQHFIDYNEVEALDYKRAILTQRANDLGYEYVKMIADRYSVKIYNASRGGNVDAFQRVSLEDYCNHV